MLLVLDAEPGPERARAGPQFHEAVGVTGLVLTKLDGTAKGGIVLAIADELRLPIRFIGVGETGRRFRRVRRARVCRRRAGRRRERRSGAAA